MKKIRILSVVGHAEFQQRKFVVRDGIRDV